MNMNRDSWKKAQVAAKEKRRRAPFVVQTLWTRGLELPIKNPEEIFEYKLLCDHCRRQGYLQKKELNFPVARIKRDYMFLHFHHVPPVVSARFRDAVESVALKGEVTFRPIIDIDSGEITDRYFQMEINTILPPVAEPQNTVNCFQGRKMPRSTCPKCGITERSFALESELYYRRSDLPQFHIAIASEINSYPVYSHYSQEHHAIIFSQDLRRAINRLELSPQEFSVYPVHVIDDAGNEIFYEES